MNRLTAPPADRLAEAARDEARRWYWHGTDNGTRPFDPAVLEECLDWTYRECGAVPVKFGGYWSLGPRPPVEVPYEPTDRGAVALGWAFICLGLCGLAFAAGCLVGH